MTLPTTTVPDTNTVPNTDEPTIMPTATVSTPKKRKPVKPVSTVSQAAKLMGQRSHRVKPRTRTHYSTMGKLGARQRWGNQTKKLVPPTATGNE